MINYSEHNQLRNRQETELEPIVVLPSTRQRRDVPLKQGTVLVPASEDKFERRRLPLRLRPEEVSSSEEEGTVLVPASEDECERRRFPLRLRPEEVFSSEEEEIEPIVLPASTQPSESLGGSPASSDTKLSHTAIPRDSASDGPYSDNPSSLFFAEFNFYVQYAGEPLLLCSVSGLQIDCSKAGSSFVTPASSPLKRLPSSLATPSPKRHKGEPTPSVFSKVFSGVRSLISSPFRSQPKVRHSTPPSPSPEHPRLVDGRNNRPSSQFLPSQPAQNSPEPSQVLWDIVGHSSSAVTDQLSKQALLAHSAEHREKIRLKVNAAFSALEDAFVGSQHDHPSPRILPSTPAWTSPKSPHTSSEVTVDHSPSAVTDRFTKQAFLALLAEHKEKVDLEVIAGFSAFEDTFIGKVCRPCDSPHADLHGGSASRARPAMTSNSDNPAIPRMVHALGYLSYALETSCAPCWALTGRLYPSDHPAFSTNRCTVGFGTNAFLDEVFKNLRPLFSREAGCANCWIPHVESHPKFPYSNHSVALECVHPNAFKQIIWAVYRTPVLWDAFSRELRRFHSGEEGWFSKGDPNTGNTASIMTVDTYVKWLCQERDGMLNIGHLAYWLLHRNGSLGKSNCAPLPNVLACVNKELEFRTRNQEREYGPGFDVLVEARQKNSPTSGLIISRLQIAATAGACGVSSASQSSSLPEIQAECLLSYSILKALVGLIYLDPGDIAICGWILVSVIFALAVISISQHLVLEHYVISEPLLRQKQQICKARYENRVKKERDRKEGVEKRELALELVLQRLWFWFRFSALSSP
ncbi:hypothetical protein C8J57DRAFT_1235611 [Mycena rebaudengoi]|nr:hypothetical protein C8J57DRAFT_1235611 [Mycena rebaudengoi]